MPTAPSEDVSSPHAAPPVPRALKVWTFLLASLLTLLLIWLLGFVLKDIGRIQGPDYAEIRKTHVDEALIESKEAVEEEIQTIEAGAKRQSERQKDLKRSMDNARTTMQQMMELQRLGLEKQSPPTETEKEALATAQQRFLEAQDAYEEANTQIADLNEQRFEKQQSLQSLRAEIEEQEKPARGAFEEASQRHQLKLATFKLAFLLPIFALAAALFLKLRQSHYRLFATSALVATFWKVGQVMWDHFPKEFFKYIAIVAAIAATVAFLLWLLRKALRPDTDLLLKRYREGYRAHVCPVCGYPIMRGPLRFARWTRKGPILSADGDLRGADDEHQSYVCPSCGTELFGNCASCGAVTPSLLPFCRHCGEEPKTLATGG